MFMLLAAMASTGMPFAVLVVVMVTVYVGVKVQTAGKQSGYRVVRIAGNAAVEPDTGRCQCCLSASSDSAADQHIRIQSLENAG